VSYLAFLLSVVLVSLSGVMAPGPITALTLGKAARSPHAGGIIAIGHGLVEFPLMLAIWGGISYLQHSTGLRVAIGLVGGVFLLLMGLGMLRSAVPGEAPAEKLAASALVGGAVLTAANPYFLFWWASVGASLVMTAVGFGLLGFVAFAVAHWLCDLVWLWLLSAMAYKGGRFFGRTFQKVTFGVCGVFLLAMSGKFIIDAVRLLRG
jgi:threonine/homoserine/homoserine lactone efflux protein